MFRNLLDKLPKWRYNNVTKKVTRVTGTKTGGATLKLDVMKIVRILAEKGMTKAELAVRSGVSRQQISTIIGRGTCAPKTAGKLAAGLGITVGEIMREVQ